VIVSPKSHVKDAPNSTLKPTTTPKPTLPPLKDAAKPEPSTMQQKPEIKQRKSLVGGERSAIMSVLS